MMLSRFMILSVLFYSCTQDLPYDNQVASFGDDDIQWFYNAYNQIDECDNNECAGDLLVQIDVNDIGKENIENVIVEISQYGEYTLLDNAEGDDQIEGNGIYSKIFNNVINSINENSSYRLDITLNMFNGDVIYHEHNIDFNRPTIIDDNISPSIPETYSLHPTEWDFYNMIIKINAPGGLNDIDAVKFYVFKNAFTETANLEGSTCEYDTEIYDEPWVTYEDWIMDYELTTTNGELVYNIAIPMRPIKDFPNELCGGYGLVQWKFEVYNKKGFYDSLESDAVEICSGECVWD